MSRMPSAMLQTVDVATIVGDDVLPAHSFALMAVSKVFREVLTVQSDIFNTHQVLQIPLPYDTHKQATAALDHMYEQYVPQPAGKTALSHKTAISLMQFGHKYDAATLFDYAHSSLIAVVQKESSKVNPRNTVSDHVVSKIVDITNAAEDFNDDLLDTCVAWFKENIRRCKSHQTILHRLDKTIMLRLLTAD